jgi:rod shape determining protein RodA
MAKQSNIQFTLEKQAADYFDWITFFLTTLLVAAGLISIYSATYDSGMSIFFSRQVMYTAVGFAAMFAFMFAPERWIYVNSLPIYIITLLLLLLVFPFGKEIYGTKGWIDTPFMRLQPSEFAKFSTLLMIANHLSKKGTDIRTIRDLAIVGAYIALPTILIVIEPDIGSASVIGALTLGILLWTGFDVFTLFFVVSLPIVIIASIISVYSFVASISLFSIISAFFRKRVAVTIAAIAIVGAAGYSSPKIVEHLAPHQQGRIQTFLNPGNDPRGKGYNVIQSILAVGSGGIAGKGFLQGTQTQLRYIPKQWTDFIFCVPTEEFGFIGGSAVILLLAGLIYRSVNLASEAPSPFMSIICVGVGTIFFYHTVINIGMAIGMMPVMGIPLPFLSAGGSSLVVNMSMVGLLLNSFRAQRKKMYNS